MEITYIYGIWDLSIQKFVYIGKSNTPCERFKGHMKCSGNADLRKLVEERGRNNFQIELLEIVKYEISRDWIKQEKFWVAKFRQEGHPLCNRNDGGGGPSEHSEETRIKMSGENHPLYGKRRSKGVVVKISKTLMGHEVIEATRTKIGKTLTDKPKSEKHKANMCKPKSEEHKVSIGKGVARPYPAFYNDETKEYILAGVNLLQMCREWGLNYWVMYRLKRGVPKRSCSGWRLA